MPQTNHNKLQNTTKGQQAAPSAASKADISISLSAGTLYHLKLSVVLSSSARLVEFVIFTSAITAMAVSIYLPVVGFCHSPEFSIY
jgi:hypothetical protein